jgi:hypothetical protein
VVIRNPRDRIGESIVVGSRDQDRNVVARPKIPEAGEDSGQECIGVSIGGGGVGSIQYVERRRDDERWRMA